MLPLLIGTIKRAAPADFHLLHHTEQALQGANQEDGPI